MIYKKFSEYSINEHLFYSICEYLKFINPSKWKDIHQYSDFDCLLKEEIQELSNETINWLKSIKESSMNPIDEDYTTKTTLFYMSLAYIYEDDNKSYYKESIYKMNKEDLSKLYDDTIIWLNKGIK